MAIAGRHVYNVSKVQLSGTGGGENKRQASRKFCIREKGRLSSSSTSISFIVLKSV